MLFKTDTGTYTGAMPEHRRVQCSSLGAASVLAQLLGTHFCRSLLPVPFQVPAHVVARVDDAGGPGVDAVTVPMWFNHFFEAHV
jgi:hypothetical protein